MKKGLLAGLIGLTLAGSAMAGHGEKPHAEHWTNATLTEKLAAMPEGNIANGQALHVQMMCNSCHGEQGESPSRNYASLNGQTKEYTMKMLLDYRDSRRWEDYKQANIMVKLARVMSDQDIADVAAFYAEQDMKAWDVDYTKDARIERLVAKGNANIMLTPCASCHGVHGEGNGITPAIAGQVPEYFVRTMKAYQEGHRNNDVHKGMSQFTHDLSDEDIKALANYYAQLPGGEK